MIYEISNEFLTVKVSDAGAELMSIVRAGREYLWQGDTKYWGGHSPVLFPFVGRLCNEKYTVHGKEYSMLRHGFAKKCTFDVIESSDDSITLGITDTPATLEVYPFHFEFQVTYALDEDRLVISYKVQNVSDEIMYFGLGGHPGFNVPMEEGLSFEDYYLEFAEKCLPDKIEMTENVLLAGVSRPYPLEDGRKIRLHHDLFDNDALVLQNMADTVTIKSDKSEHSVTVRIPGIPYVGFWHAVRTDAPYVAIEPWVTLPAREGVTEEFAARWDLIRLGIDEFYENIWDITIK